MKLLSTEQQTELRELLEILGPLDGNVATQSLINYWKIELKPKRTRKKKETILDTSNVT